MSFIDPGKRSAEEDIESERQKRVRVIKDSLLLSEGCFDPARLIRDGWFPSEGLDPAEIRLRLISHAQDLLRSDGLDPAIADEQDWNQLLLGNTVDSVVGEDAAQDAGSGGPESEAAGVEEAKRPQQRRCSIDWETFDFEGLELDFDGGEELSSGYYFKDGRLVEPVECDE